MPYHPGAVVFSDPHTELLYDAIIAFLAGYDLELDTAACLHSSGEDESLLPNHGFSPGNMFTNRIYKSCVRSHLERSLQSLNAVLLLDSNGEDAGSGDDRDGKASYLRLIFQPWDPGNTLHALEELLNTIPCLEAVKWCILNGVAFRLPCLP